jgi:hypothetical protein
VLEENGRPVEAARGFGRDAEEGEDVAVGRLGVVLFARVAPTLHNLRKVHPKEGRVGSTPPVWLWMPHRTYNSGERRHYNEGSPWPPRHHFIQLRFDLYCRPWAVWGKQWKGFGGQSVCHVQFAGKIVCRPSLGQPVKGWRK